MYSYLVPNQSDGALPLRKSGAVGDIPERNGVAMNDSDVGQRSMPRRKSLSYSRW